MNYTRFDRHKHMTPEITSLILELTEKVLLMKNVDKQLRSRLRNYLYGLFDGFLYKDIPEITKALCGDDLTYRLEKRAILAVYSICKEYPVVNPKRPLALELDGEE